MASLCFYQDEDNFFDLFSNYLDNIEVQAYNQNQKIISFQIDSIEELFDICYAINLKSNILKAIEIYSQFGSETKDATLFLIYDNKFIDQLYSDDQLESIAKEINKLIDTEDNNVYCFFDGEKFELLDKRYTSIEESTSMRNIIKDLYSY